MQNDNSFFIDLPTDLLSIIKERSGGDIDGFCLRCIDEKLKTLGY